MSAKFSKPLIAGLAWRSRSRTPTAPRSPGTTAYDAATRDDHLHARPRRSPAFVNVHRDADRHRRPGQPGRRPARPGRSRRRKPRGRAGRLPVHAVRRRARADGRSRTADTAPVTLGVRFTSDADGTSPASGSTRAPTTPAPTPARCGPRPAPQLATGTFTNESTTRLADAHASRRRWRSPRTPSTSRPTAPTSAATRRPRTRSRGRPVAGTAAGGRDRGRLHLRHRLPELDARRRNYLVDVVFEKAAPTHRDRRPGPGPRRRRRAARNDRSRSSFSAPIKHRLRDADGQPGGTPPSRARPTLERRRHAAHVHAVRSRCPRTPTSRSTLSRRDVDRRAPTLPTQTWTFRTGEPTTARAADAVRRRGARRSLAADDGAAVELGHRVRASRRRHGHGDPVLQGRRQRRHPRRLALELAPARGWRR